MMSKGAHAGADELYKERSHISAVQQSVEILVNDPNRDTDYEIQWRMSRAYFFLGQEDKSETERSFFKRGIIAGQQAVSLSPDRIEGHFWLAVNQALIAESIASLSALPYVIRALGHLRHACKIDPRFHGAGPLRIKARLKHKLPWPLGSQKDSERLYRRALSLCPHNSVTRIFFADLLHDLGRRDEEQDQLKMILSLPDDAEWNFELCRDKELAAKRLGNERPELD